MKYKILNDCRGFKPDKIIDTILESRGIQDTMRFLYPVKNDLLPLTDLKNIDVAHDRLMRAIWDGKKIGILADVDADGIMSCAILTRYIKEVLHYPVKTFINEGKLHGLKNQNLTRFKDIGLLIIVDSLDSDTLEYETLISNDIDIIILDHHKVDKNINYSDFLILVSSQVDYKNPNLSGAGVVWKFIKYIDKTHNYHKADEYLDLAAVGILADVMDVSEESKENRYIISEGLKHLNNLGLKKILSGYEFNSKSVLYSIAPLINASNRIGMNRIALDIFLENDNKELLSYKKLLEKCKEIQSNEVENIMPNLIEQYENQKDSKVLYFVFESEYGISGLLGNKLLSMYNKPLFVLSKKDNVYTGSMRSIGYGDFADIVNQTGLARCDGHEQAAGVIIPTKNLEELIHKLNYIICTKQVEDENELIIDAEISLDDLSKEMLEKVKRINLISGEGFKPLKFKISNISNYDIGNFKNGKHLTISPNEHIMLIEWNTKCNFEELEEHSMLNDSIDAYGELEDGFIGKSYKIKLILDDYYIE